jgi:hypothetical protein
VSEVNTGYDPKQILEKLIVCCFSVTSDPLFDAGFFLVLVRMVCFGVEPSQVDDFVDRSCDGHRAALIAGKFSAVNFVSIGHWINLLSPRDCFLCFCHSTACKELQPQFQCETDTNRLTRPANKAIATVRARKYMI